MSTDTQEGPIKHLPDTAWARLGEHAPSHRKERNPGADPVRSEDKGIVERLSDAIKAASRHHHDYFLHALKPHNLTAVTQSGEDLIFQLSDAEGEKAKAAGRTTTALTKAGIAIRDIQPVEGKNQLKVSVAAIENALGQAKVKSA